MTALQTVNLGTAPAATDGDPVRTGFAKTNSNMAVLNAQATLTSAAPITAAQALTAALHLGKRVNIALASAGIVQMPTAASCGADGIIHLRNVGTTVITLAIGTGSGDTVALSALNPGEAALMDSDGVHAWTVLMRGRTNSDNEVVNGNCTVAGNETVGGTLSVGGNILNTTPENPVAFPVRPTFNGNPPWDLGNFNPATLTGRLLGVKAFGTVGAASYTRNAALTFAIVEQVGGGGGGGGCPQTGANQGAAGSGGAGGGFARYLLTAAQIDAAAVSGDVALTIGAPGAGALGNVGTTGGNTSFGTNGSICTCTGGPGGGISGPTSSPQAAASAGGGVVLKVGTALIATSGNPGGSSAFSVAGATYSLGNGATSALGAGGVGGAGVTGGAASGRGAGGGGTVLGASQNALAGGSASPGYILIYEYA